ncbi:AraC family transcriptional regulator [Brevibacillus parabrevis]|uniref:AraC family transcriptional regulator n=1 Tax=Brevibacillus parabrevis TaxID=54914 RepID=UPI002E1C6AAF|nr:AraC family transcriptional regulator [Brevibacillus parabrevis]MED1723975.1 AraC family transcriptional regulator [Brevibacillus parabrevis]
MQEVAASVGYHDVLYFSRLFKKHTGMTPTSFSGHAPGPDRLYGKPGLCIVDAHRESYSVNDNRYQRSFWGDHPHEQKIDAPHGNSFHGQSSTVRERVPRYSQPDTTGRERAGANWRGTARIDSSPALECPMEVVDLTFSVLDFSLSFPRAETITDMITFGFDENVHEAAMIALEGMLDWMVELYGFERKEALNLASLLVDLRITQLVNGVNGVHAVLFKQALLE